MKFNTAATVASVRKREDATRNFGGGVAFQMEPKERLYTRVVTSLCGENKYYQSGEEHNQEIINDVYAVAKDDPEFILKLAAYARNKMYLRSTPIMLLVEASALPECKPFVRKWTPKIIRRADEPAEAISCWLAKFGNKAGFPNSLKKGISDALLCFDEYQIEKYNRNASVKLRDVLRICHTKPRNQTQNAIFNYLTNGEIDPEYMPKTYLKRKFTRLSEFNEIAKEMIKNGSITWEVAVAQFGNKKEVWEALNLPFMAMLRNLRNMVQTGASLGSVIERLDNPETVERSKQFPFRFFSAYRELKGDISISTPGNLLAALSQAIEYSIINAPRLKGSTLVACDNSGSMDMNLSNRSKVTYMDIANLFGALANDICDKAIVGAFGSDWAKVNLNPRDSIFTKMEEIERADTKGVATNAIRIFEWMLDKNVKVDRVLLFSDMQCYDENLFTDKSAAEIVAKYRSKINPNLIVYSIDLAGYGTVQLPSDDPRLAKIAGWSDKIFKFIPAFESNKTTAIKEIENYS